MKKRCRLIPWLAALALPVLLSPPSVASTVIAPSFDQMVDSSDYIVRATVKSVESDWRPNPDKPGERFIGTRVELEVHEVIKGNPPSPLVLDLVGGRAGDKELTISGAPKFTVGQESVLFVKGNGRRIVPLVGMAHGKYNVRKNKKTGREEIVRSDGQLLFHEAEVALPTPVAKATLSSRTDELPLTPAEFAERIRQKAKLRTREDLK